MHESVGSGPEETPNPIDVKWLLTQFSSFDFPSELDGYAYNFACNAFGMLAKSEQWSRVSGHWLDASIWCCVVFQSYLNFASRADFVVEEKSIFDVLHEQSLGEEELVDAVLQRFYGHSLQDVESFGLPDPYDTNSLFPSWSDRVIDEVADAAADFRRLLRKSLGAPEFILNFYRDPGAWEGFVENGACPRTDAPLDVEDSKTLMNLLKEAERTAFVG